MGKQLSLARLSLVFIIIDESIIFKEKFEALDKWLMPRYPIF